MAETGRKPVTFEFECDSRPWYGTPVVNGRKMAVSSFDVHLDCESVPVVTLSLAAADGLRLMLGGGALVRVGDETREALISLGWTPPEPGETVSAWLKHAHNPYRVAGRYPDDLAILSQETV